MAPQIGPPQAVKQLEECMSNNWQDVPRDPIMDDDELEALYQLTELQNAKSLADLRKRANTRVTKSKPARGSEEAAAPAA
jgi:hypothetical protein